ncbi:MAG: UPF0158 family protein [Thermodesulfobacteriota bacterium]|nr:UPF0158 family protein [Thermodesulfobacteriota bacterium]
MKITFDDIENAFMFVSMQPEFGNQALLSKTTGKIYYISEFGDSDELPDDIEDSDDYIEIPHKNELDLGKQLVFQFVTEYLPDEYDKVAKIFRRKGAYSRYKDLLDQKGLSDQWHKFEDSKQTKALRKWCSENNIDFIG